MKTPWAGHEFPLSRTLHHFRRLAMMAPAEWWMGLGQGRRHEYP